ncbi:MAG: glycosyltransferase family 4 protein [Myxococcota bacterium]|jgi:glycosyltransferase involved in cell wall biosynthesis|nr:glycosyltransferase family 4 protein [Myxococcota bacterium]
MKRILFIHDLLNFRSGGAVLVVRNLLAAMDRSRFELELATPRSGVSGPQEVPEEFRELGLPLHALPPFTQTSDRSPRGVAAAAWQLLRLSVSIFFLMLRRKPDFVYVHSITSLHFASLPALLTGTRLVYHEHSVQSVRGSSLWVHLYPWLVARAAHIICIAQVIEDEVVEGGVESERVSTVPNGIGPSVVPPRLPDPDGPPQESFHVIQIANLLPWKGHATVIRAAALARDEIAGLRVSFYGRGHNSDTERNLRALNSELEVDDIVEFCGFSEDLEERLPEFDCLVVASDAEPFGLVLLEGMRTGVPVIGTRAGGVPEIVTHESDGLLFEPDDHETLARYLVKLASDRAYARRLAERGLETHVARFSVETQAKGVEAIFEELG